MASQFWDRKKIESYQDKQLIKVVRHAAEHVPYYRKLFKEINFDPFTFRGRVDMGKIPLLDKETLRTHQSEFIADNAEQYGVNWDSTSGSTGTPLKFIVDNSSKANKLAGVLRAYRWAGYFPWKKAFSIQSYNFKKPHAFSKHYRFVNLWRFDAKKLKKQTALEVINMVNEVKPKIFIGYPFSLFMLAQFAKEEGHPIYPLDAIVTAGETLSERRRKMLEDTYQCRVNDFYSHHENVAIITECKHQTKHIYEDFAYNEIVDEVGNEASGQGEGQLVGTGFYNFAMPLIRYKLGDIVALSENKDGCQCGCQFKSVKAIVGRQNDYIETPDGRFIGNVLEHSVDHAKGVKVSQCVQDAIDHIYVNLVVDDSFNEDSRIAFEEGLRARIGNEFKIDFKIVDQLEKTKSGKTPFIMSKIGHEYV